MSKKTRLVSLKEVRERIPFSKATIYRKMGDGTFPKHVKIGTQRVAWREADIDRWIEEAAGSGLPGP